MRHSVLAISAALMLAACADPAEPGQSEPAPPAETGEPIGMPAAIKKARAHARELGDDLGDKNVLLIEDPSQGKVYYHMVFDTVDGERHIVVHRLSGDVSAYYLGR